MHVVEVTPHLANIGSLSFTEGTWRFTAVRPVEELLSSHTPVPVKSPTGDYCRCIDYNKVTNWPPRGARNEASMIVAFVCKYCYIRLYTCFFVLLYICKGMSVGCCLNMPTY